MKKLLFILLIFPLFVNAQVVKQNGHVRKIIYSQKSVDIPVENVRVKVETEERSDVNGNFTLKISSNQNGTFAFAEIFKLGYTLILPTIAELKVKKYALNPQASIELVLVDNNELWEERRRIETNIRKEKETEIANYKSLITQKEKELAILKETDIQFKKLLEERDSIEKEFQEFAQNYYESDKTILEESDKLSRIDYKTLDSIEIKNMDLKKAGKGKEMVAFNKSLLSKNDEYIAKTIVAEVGKSDSNIKALQLELEKEQKEKQKKLALRDFYGQRYKDIAEGFRIDYKNDSVLVYLEKRLDLDSTNYDYIVEYAVFIRERMMQFEKSMKYFSMALRHAKSDLDKAFALNQIGMLKNELDYPLEEISKTYFNALGNLFKDESIDLPKDRLASSIFINLGNLQKEGRHFEDAEESYLTGINSIRNICNASNDVYDQLSLAKKITSLGNLRVDMEKYKFGEENLLEALDIYKSIRLKDSLFYYADLINSLNSLGSLNMKVNKPDRAKSFLNDAIIKSRSCLKSDPLKYTSVLSSCLDNMGKCKLQMNDFDSAELYLKESISLAENLASLKPEGNNHEYAIILNDYAFLKEKANQYSLAEKYYIESLAIRRKLASEKFEVYDTYLIEVLNQFSAFYMKANQYKKAEELLIESLCTCYQLKYNWADNYDVELLNILQRLSTLSRKRENSIEADIYLNEALKVRNVLVEKGLMEFESDIPVDSNIEILKTSILNENNTLISDSGNTSTFLGSISYYMILGHNYKAAEYFAVKALSQSPKQSWIKTNLALSLLLQDKFKEAKQIYLQLKGQEYPPDPGKTFKDIFLQDFDELEQKGITHPDVLKIRTLLAR